MPEPLSLPEAYQAFLYALPESHPAIRRSTRVYIPSGAFFGRVEGFLLLEQNVILCVQEYLNFELGIIEGYGCEVSRPHVSLSLADLPAASEYCRASYPNEDKLCWYDSFPHPSDPSLASTNPHYKHVPPDIRSHRIPAPELSFTRPNLPFLIQEIRDIEESEFS